MPSRTSRCRRILAAAAASTLLNWTKPKLQSGAKLVLMAPQLTQASAAAAAQVLCSSPSGIPPTQSHSDSRLRLDASAFVSAVPPASDCFTRRRCGTTFSSACFQSLQARNSSSIFTTVSMLRALLCIRQCSRSGSRTVAATPWLAACVAVMWRETDRSTSPPIQ